MRGWLSILLLLSLLTACKQDPYGDGPGRANENLCTLTEAHHSVFATILKHLDYMELCDGFDFPVGPPHARGYYNAQPYANKKYHLGEDWNAVTGGNSDLGDTVYSVADGLVIYAFHAGQGWGNVLRIAHRRDSSALPDYLESLYAHLDTMILAPGQRVRRGQAIGTIGTADGLYTAHLHLEFRKHAMLPLGGGYGYDTTYYLHPTRFIRAHRPGK